MNENINLTKILKNCPKETKLYSILHGEVKYVGINNKSPYKVEFKSEDGEIFGVTLDGRHLSYFNGECILLPSKDQRNWSKFTAPWYKKKFDLKALKPFDKVIYRNSVNHQWIAGLFSHFSGEEYYDVYICNGCICVYCVPYNDDTKHLVGTKDEAPEYYRYWED